MAGLALTLALLALAWTAHRHFGVVLGWAEAIGLRPWAEDLRWPLYGVAAALVLTAAEWLWQRVAPKH